MTTFDKREQDFENRFKHDEELRFKVLARRNKLLGLWAAAQMGLAGDAALAYAGALIAAEFEPGGDSHVIDKLAVDLADKGVALTPAQIRFELDHFAAQAKQQLLDE